MSQLDPTWKVVNIPSFAGGVNTSQLPDLIQDSQTTVMRNLSMSEGRIRNDSGYTSFGGDNYDAVGALRQAMIHESASGTRTSIAITDNTVVKLVRVVAVLEGAPTPDWQLISTDEAVSTGLRDFTPKNLSAAVLADATIFKVATGGSDTFSTDWKREDNILVGVMLDGGRQHIGYVEGVTSAGGDYSVTLDRPFPLGADIGNSVVSGLKLQGRAEDTVSTTHVGWGDGSAAVVPWIVFTNGVDVPLYFDGTYVKRVPNLQGAAHSTVTCKYVSVYKGTVILANCVVDSNPKVNTIMWSDIGKAGVWNTGNAGENALLEEGDPITGLLPLGEDMMVYGLDSIIRMRYIGSTNFLFSFTSALTSITVGGINVGQAVGAVAGNAIHNMGDSHIFLGNNGIYLYRGGYSAERISDPIYKEWFGTGGNFNPELMDKAFALYNRDRKELSFFSPSTGDTRPSKALVLQLDSINSSTYQGGGVTFREREYPSAISGGGEASTQETQLWSSFTSNSWKYDPVGSNPFTPIGSDTNWNSSLLGSFATVPMLGSFSTLGNLLGTFKIGTQGYLSGLGNKITVAGVPKVPGPGTDYPGYLLMSLGSYLVGVMEDGRVSSGYVTQWTPPPSGLNVIYAAMTPPFKIVDVELSCDMVDNSPIITVPSIANLVVGSWVTGTSVGIGAKITLIDSSDTTHVTVSVPSTGTTTNNINFRTYERLDYDIPVEIYTTGAAWGIFSVGGADKQLRIVSSTGTVVNEGLDLTWELQSKDFSGMDKDIRTDFIDMGLKGTDIGVAVSRDSRDTWTSMGNVTSDSTSTRSRLHSQGVSNNVAFRIKGTGPVEIGPTVIRWREEDRYRLT